MHSAPGERPGHGPCPPGAFASPGVPARPSSMHTATQHAWISLSHKPTLAKAPAQEDLGPHAAARAADYVAGALIAVTTKTVQIRQICAQARTRLTTLTAIHTRLTPQYQ
jgi:hypothetical protein